MPNPNKCIRCGGVAGPTQQFFCDPCNRHGESAVNKPHDPVNHPSHYTSGGIEAIDGIRAALGDEAFIAFCRGNAMKYAWRAGKKGATSTDVAKGAWYLRKAEEVAREMEAQPQLPLEPAPQPAPNLPHEARNEVLLAQANHIAALGTVFEEYAEHHRRSPQPGAKEKAERNQGRAAEAFDIAARLRACVWTGE
jgi:hypothetical protein